MSSVRPSRLLTVADVEIELTAAIKDLRRIHAGGSQNLLAVASTESRIGALRKRKMVLELGPLPPSLEGRTR